MLNRHIFLIGMPSSGKSTLGRKVSADMKLNYIDMDQMIQDIFGCKVSDIFATWGEEAFRNAETNALIQLTRMENALISTGGGTVLNPVNRAIMRNCGYIVLIDRPLEQILTMRTDTRPLLASKGAEGITKMYNERIGIYRAAADIVMDNSAGYWAGVNGLERIIRSL